MAVWVTGHLILTSLPEAALPAVDVGVRLDWPVHFGLLAVGGMLVARAAGGTWPARRFLTAWAALALFGALDEWHQPYFGRTAEWMDWIMDVLGAAVGLAAGTRLARRA